MTKKSLVNLFLKYKQREKEIDPKILNFTQRDYETVVLYIFFHYNDLAILSNKENSSEMSKDFGDI